MAQYAMNEKRDNAMGGTFNTYKNNRPTKIDRDFVVVGVGQEIENKSFIGATYTMAGKDGKKPPLTQGSCIILAKTKKPVFLARLGLPKYKTLNTKTMFWSRTTPTLSLWKWVCVTTFKSKTKLEKTCSSGQVFFRPKMIQ